MTMHPSESSPHRQAALPLDFLVVGAGIAGLAVAYALARDGHRVHVLERYTSITAYPAVGGVRLPPNATKILVEWGFAAELEELALPIRGSGLHSLYTGEIVGYLSWQDAVMKESGGQFLVMHHADLHNMLYRRCLSLGVRIDFASAITTVTSGLTALDRPQATLASGEVLSADIVIGADGQGSTVRELLFTRGEVIRSEMTVLTGTIPREALVGDAELQKLIVEASKDGMKWVTFMGSHRGILAYPVGKYGYTLHFFWPESDLPPLDGEDDGSWEHKLSASLIPTQDYCSLLQRLMSHVPSMVRRPYLQWKLEDWTDKTSRIVLLGEAAHPLMPAGTYVTSTDLGDAAVFATLFARLRDIDQVPHLIAGYQELRQRRVEYVVRADELNSQMVRTPAGPAQEARDARLRTQSKCSPVPVTEDVLREQWESIAGVYGYSAIDEAEAWWVNWGELRERAHNRTPQEMELKWDIVGVEQEEGLE